MIGKVSLEIKSSHKLSGQPAQQMTSAAQGTCFIKGEAYHVLYEDLQNGGDALIKNHLILRPGRMELRQKGAVRSKMVFEPGKQCDTSYFTPYGQIGLSIKTDRFDLVWDGETAGEDREGGPGFLDDGVVWLKAHAAYTMESNGESMTECQMEINIRAC